MRKIISHFLIIFADMKHKLLILLLLAAAVGAKAQEDSSRVSLPIVPYTYGWSLHEGLNATLSLSLTADFGSHHRNGVGFTQRLAATYLKPLSDNLWIAGGMTVGNTLWGSSRYANGAFYAALGYRFDEHWEAYAWVQKQVANDYPHRYWSPFYDYIDAPYSYGPYGYGDRIGAALKYNLNPNVSFQISVEGVKAPQSHKPLFDRHEYPVGKD